MIVYKVGDLLKSDCDVIIHGCNCFHTMGGGIAKQVRSIYPEAYRVDVETTNYGDISKLGTYSYVITKNIYTGKTLYIINAYTQFDFKFSDEKVNVNYDAIESVMLKLNDLFVDTHDIQFKIGLPKIGAGLAGGDWNIISEIINKVFGERTVYVYEFNP